MIQFKRITSNFLYEEKKVGLVFVLPAFLVLVVFVFYPVLSNILMSFFRISLNAEREFVGVQNYSSIFRNKEFWNALYYTCVYVISTTFITTALGVVVALTMNCKFPLRGVIRAIILIPYVAPVAAVVYGWQFFFDPVNGPFIDWMVNGLHLMQERINLLKSPNTSIWFAIIFSIWKNFPFTYLMVLALLQSIDKNLYEAAAIDGANMWERFKKITLPEIYFVIGATILLRFIWNFNKFEEVFLFSSSVRTLPIFTYYEAFVGNIDLGTGASVAVIQFVLILGLMFLYIKKVLKW